MDPPGCKIMAGRLLLDLGEINIGGSIMSNGKAIDLPKDKNGNIVIKGGIIGGGAGASRDCNNGCCNVCTGDKCHKEPAGCGAAGLSVVASLMAVAAIAFSMWYMWLKLIHSWQNQLTLKFKFNE